MGKDPSSPIPTRDLSPEEQARVVGLLTRVQDRLLFNVEATDDDRRLTAYALRSARQGALLRAWIGPLAVLFERFPDPSGGGGAPRGRDEQQDGRDGVGRPDGGGHEGAEADGQDPVSDPRDV